MNSEKIKVLDKLSFYILIFVLFSSFLFFIVYLPISLEASKGFLISIGVCFSLLFWLLARIKEGKIQILKDKIWILGLIVPLIFLTSTFFQFLFTIHF
jgi:hypothetical protein